MYQDILRVTQKHTGIAGKTVAVIFNPPLWAVACYRLGHFLWRSDMILFPQLLSLLGRLVSGVAIAPSAEIGPGVLILHGSGVVIEEDVHIGTGATIYQGVGMGQRFSCTASDGLPIIGKDVTIYAGAKILGPIRVGNHCCIGANAVVIRSFDDNTTIAGVPARAVGEHVRPTTTIGDGTLLRVGPLPKEHTTPARAYASSVYSGSVNDD
jgi:serine O-acetyltransferase